MSLYADHRRPPHLLADAMGLMRTEQGTCAGEHATRVMLAMGSEDAKVVAILHGAQTVSRGLLRELLPERLLMAVAAFSRAQDESNDVYFDAILADPLAVEVKLACLGDLADPSQLAETDVFSARRTIRECTDAAHKLGTSLPAVLARWDSGRSPYA